MPPEEGDRRKHVRHHSSLEADVSLPTHGHLELIESTHLGNISGGGARFASKRIEYYSIGQELRLRIYLPDHNDEKKKIDCLAHVVWVNDQAGSLDPSVSIAMNYIFDPAQIRLLTAHSETAE